MGCDTPKTEMTVLNKAQILEQIDETPLLAKELCGQMAEASEREFCIQYALQVMPKDEVATLRAMLHLRRERKGRVLVSSSRDNIESRRL